MQKMVVVLNGQFQSAAVRLRLSSVNVCMMFTPFCFHMSLYVTLYFQCYRTNCADKMLHCTTAAAISFIISINKALKAPTKSFARRFFLFASQNEINVHKEEIKMKSFAHSHRVKIISAQLPNDVRATYNFFGRFDHNRRICGTFQER